MCSLQVQQQLRQAEGQVEDLRASVGTLRTELEQRIEDVSRGVMTATHHLGIPAAVMEELALLESQAQQMTSQLDTLQRDVSQRRDASHRQELEDERDGTILELAELQTQLDDCRSAAGTLERTA